MSTKYSTLIILIISLSFTILNGSPTNAQGLREKVSLSVKNKTLKQIYKEVENQVDYRFVYSDENIPVNKILSIKMDASLESILEYIERNSPTQHKLMGKNIVVNYLSPQTPGTISGRVVDQLGNALAGASIHILESNQKTSSNQMGQFSLQVAPGTYSLNISYVSYEPQKRSSVQVLAGKTTDIRISMVESSDALNEIVVIGYGAIKRSDLTGSVTDISAEKLKDQPTSSIDQKLIGRVAGMQISQGSGAPGAGTTVKIRGSGSLGAGNDPLYVIDGMPYSAESNLDTNPLSFINPSDIENISVLKDASSTAIYGSRGANGVIMITTKNAGKEKNEVNITGYTGVNQIPQAGRPEMMNAQEFVTYQRDRITTVIRQKFQREPVESDFPEGYQNIESFGEGTNWYDQILRNGLMQNYTVDLQKSVDKSKFFLGFGYFNQEGAIYNSGFERLSANFNYLFDFKDKLQITAALRPSYITQDRVVSGYNRNDPLSIALWAPPIYEPYDEQGNLIPYFSMPSSPHISTAWGFPNPLYVLENTKNKYNELRNLGNISLQWNISNAFRFKTALSTVYNNVNFNSFTPSTVGSPNTPPRAESAMAGRSRSNGFNWLVENTLNYNQTFGKHDVAGLVGYTIQKSTSRSLNLNAGPFPNDLIETINAAPAITSWGEGIGEWSMISYLGRINYAYNNKYLLTATLRSDGSSRFGSENKFAFFPSVAAAWKVSDEEFFNSIENIDQLKIRASYGRNGNNNIGNYTHLSTINPTQYVFNNKTVSASTITLANPFLGWEESEQYDLGIDLSLWKNRLTFTGDLYRRRSVKMLLNDYIPTITGFSNQLVNKGNVENKGIELAVDGTPISGDLTWNIGANISFNRNKILSINDNNDYILSGSVDGRASNISEIGKPIGMFYGFILDGVYSTSDLSNPDVPKYPGTVAGYPKYKDLNGDGTIQEILDYTSLGSPHPNFTYGFNTSLNYKNIDLSISANGRQGGYVMNGIRQTIDNLQGLFNIGKEWANRWRGDDNPGDGIHAAGPQIVHRVNTLWLENASYFRINNMTIGYSVPKNIFRGSEVFKNLRIYGSAQNILTVTKYKGANPEGQSREVNNTLSPGFDSNAYPIPRTFIIGLNVKF
ncbi:SusC/RagA family TonB-linked outer membrane protein [Sphingobacterium daejeonense]|uniref:SusC/RagA family TonB-linked outer membrane protein n=1 Tax=Sphingobacterium daejeonense TaxID=371142 RepID=A0ABW3RMG2_9SPHI